MSVGPAKLLGPSLENRGSRVEAFCASSPRRCVEHTDCTTVTDGNKITWPVRTPTTELPGMNHCLTDRNAERAFLNMQILEECKACDIDVGSRQRSRDAVVASLSEETAERDRPAERIVESERWAEQHTQAEERAGGRAGPRLAGWAAGETESTCRVAHRRTPGNGRGGEQGWVSVLHRRGFLSRVPEERAPRDGAWCVWVINGGDS